MTVDFRSYPHFSKEYVEKERCVCVALVDTVDYKVLVSPTNETFDLLTRGTRRCVRGNITLFLPEPTAIADQITLAIEWANNEYQKRGHNTKILYVRKDEWRKLSPLHAEKIARDSLSIFDKIVEALGNQFKSLPFTLSAVGSVSSGVADPDEAFDLDIHIGGIDACVKPVRKFLREATELRYQIHKTANENGFSKVDFWY